MAGSIIVGVDGSRDATNAARVAASLARDLDRPLVLAHVVDDPSVFPYGDRWRREVQRRHAIQRGSELLEAVATEIGEPTAGKRIAFSGLLQGGVDERLAALSREEDSDLLMVGSRSRGRPARFLLRTRFGQRGEPNRRTPPAWMSAASRGL